MALTFSQPLPIEYTIWRMAERFGWTLEYCEGLSVARWHEFYQIEDGEGHAKTSLFRKGKA